MRLFFKNKIQLIIYLVFIIGIVSCNLSAKSEKAKKEREKQKNDSLEIADIQLKTKKIEDFFKFFSKETDFNGGALVAYKGKIIYHKVQGLANKKKNEPLKLNSRFQLASVTKPITAIAIMCLYQDSLLNLDDLVSKHILNFPYPKITVRMLLSHRSGLSNYMYFAETLTNRRDIIYNEQVVEMMLKHKPKPYLQPDIQYDYCNTNYVLLAAIIEKISGKKYENFVKERIFDVADMKESFFFQYGKENPTENLATGYHFKWEEALRTYQEGVIGDKGMYSTLEDLYKLDQCLYTEKILKKETLELMIQPANPEMEKSNYGFGWRIPMSENYKGIVLHGGWYRGFNTMFARDLTNKNTVILFSNVRTRIMGDAYREIIKILRNIEPEISTFTDVDSLKVKNDSVKIQVDSL